MTATFLPLSQLDGTTDGVGRIGRGGSAFGYWLTSWGTIRGRVFAGYGGGGHALW